MGVRWDESNQIVAPAPAGARAAGRRAEPSHQGHSLVQIHVAGGGGIPAPAPRICHDAPPQLLPLLRAALVKRNGAVQGCGSGRRGTSGRRGPSVSGEMPASVRGAGAAGQPGRGHEARGALRCGLLGAHRN